MLGTPGTAWLIDYPMAVDHRLQHLAGHGVLDDALLLRAAGGAAVAAGDRRGWPAHPAGSTLRDVVFPHIRGHVLTNTLLISLWTFNDFSPFLLTAGGPNHESEILPVYIYNVALQGGELGLRARRSRSCC